MAGAARRANVPLLLAGPVCNLRDQSPLQTLSKAGLNPESERRIAELLSAGEAQMAQGDFTAALQNFDEARAIDDGRALLTYRRAQCLEQLGRLDEAAAAYALARDQDGCRFRAPSAFNTILAEVAGAADASFIDLAAELETARPPAAPGHDFFLEHVHFNQAGHARVALRLAEHIVTKIRKQDWAPERVPSQIDYERRLGLLPQDELAALSMTLLALERAPLNSAPDQRLQVEFARQELSRQMERLSPPELAAFAELPLDAMEADLVGNLSARYGEAREFSLQVELLRKGTVRRPWSSALHLQLAQALAHQEDWQAARHSVRRALELEPGSILAQKLSDLIERELAGRTPAP
jgi:Flp pilus assembly protein TadD